MSTNLNIFAEREIEVVKTGSRQTQRVNYLYTWPTPTEVTKKIMQATDRKQEYIDWILYISEDEIVNVYAEDDHFEENPICTKVLNTGKEHINNFIKWCNYMEKEGYEIKFKFW